MENNLAPIVLFVYNRPWHTLQTLESLKLNELASKSELFIYADGPKDNASVEDLEKIKQTREIIQQSKWCGKNSIIESEKNHGLASSVINGVTKIINEYGKIIVLEDDLIVAKCFLKFMNDGLALYSDSQNIYSINGYMFPVNTEKNETVLLPYISTWGWATWKNKWNGLEISDINKSIFNQNKFIMKRFNLADYDYVSMLNNKQNSWGILWYYKVFIKNGLNVYPSKSLVKNIGFDGSGENCGIDKGRSDFNSNTFLEISKVDELDLNFYSVFLNYFTLSKNKKNYLSYLKNLIRFRWV
jgi:hypothetical protein